jgi:hypothetical protein
MIYIYTAMPTTYAPTTTPRKRRPAQDSCVTQLEKLYGILSDGDWHSTRELARRVGHCFGRAKFQLVAYGHTIELRPHPTKRWQRQYRMSDAPNE